MFTPVFFALREDIFTSDLSLVYLYRQSEQSDEFLEADGLCNISAEYGTISIGISVEALKYDLDYSVMVLIHEITHLLCKGTSPTFLCIWTSFCINITVSLIQEYAMTIRNKGLDGSPLTVVRELSEYHKATE